MNVGPIIAAALAFAAVMAVGTLRRAGSSSEGWSRRLDLAGISDPASQRAYRMANVALAISLCLSCGLLAALAGSSPMGVAVASTVGAAVGWWIPRRWVEAQCARRRRAMACCVPVMLDLLQISIRGGMGLPAAWSSVAGSLRDAGEALSQEMRRVDLEVSFGGRWSVALGHAYERTGVKELRALASLMEQTERFGSELASMLEVMADSLRDAEMQALEERAQRAWVKILFPLAALMLPATLLLIVTPMLLLLFEALGRATS